MDGYTIGVYTFIYVYRNLKLEKVQHCIFGIFEPINIFKIYYYKKKKKNYNCLQFVLFRVIEYRKIMKNVFLSLCRHEIKVSLSFIIYDFLFIVTSFFLSFSNNIIIP